MTFKERANLSMMMCIFFFIKDARFSFGELILIRKKIVYHSFSHLKKCNEHTIIRGQHNVILFCLALTLFPSEDNLFI